MRNSKPLENLTAIVTGASSGIGRAIAEKLGGAGAHVFLAGRNEQAMHESKQNIENLGAWPAYKLVTFEILRKCKVLLTLRWWLRGV